MGHTLDPKILYDHDLHIHTTLSECCKDSEATPSKIIKRAAALGIGTVGFANHVWDASIPGASQWYVPQNLDHILSIRSQIPEDTQGVNVLVGCESEYCGQGRVGISREAAEQLDFVLLPMSHFHMTGFVVEKWQVANEKAVADLLVQRFLEVIELGLATGIAHPFSPLGFKDSVDAIFLHISDGAFEDCFGRAAELGVSIEIQPNMLPGSLGRETEGFHDASFLRVLSIARDMGCQFHLGSDAHKLSEIRNTMKLKPYLEQLGIPKERFRSFAKLHSRV